MDSLEYGRYLRLLRVFFEDRELAGDQIIRATALELVGTTTYLCFILSDGMGSLSTTRVSTDPFEGDLALPIPTFDDETMEQIEAGMAPYDAAMFFVIKERMEDALYTQYQN